MPDLSDTLLARILDTRVYDVATETPLDRAPILSRRLGAQVWLKREDLQPVFSFKLRGAYSHMVRLDPGQRARGVVAASAGNHAQGVALAAQRLGCPATLVMPTTTPPIKVEAVARRGAEVILTGDGYDEAYAHGRHLAESRGAAFIHPFDDLDVVAGQGTIGMELLRQLPLGLDAVFVPVGGGGLLAGVASLLKRLRPSVKVIGVEPVGADAMARSLEAGHRVRLDRVDGFADGVAVRQVGQLPFDLCRGAVDEVVRVEVGEICTAIRDVFEENRALLEPSGALAVAGLQAWVRSGRAEGLGPMPGLVALLTGANLSFERLGTVLAHLPVPQPA